ncbi:triple tyrosine motif-containing protein [Spirosoma telluris]|uniref:triple tyrosine motif-containing protein n=1 Tax=Spirosoma telluris TaxID=2183553 RepID=UPI002FC2750E
MEFAALDFFSNGKNNYQYQLTGYDDHWVLAGQRNYVRYANLPPGDYTFQVKTANQDGHWSQRIHKLKIHIEPPFWRTASFILIVILLLILAIWGGFANARMLFVSRKWIVYDCRMTYRSR